MGKYLCNDCGVAQGEQHQIGCISRVDEGITKPDFEALRAERNASVQKSIEELAKRNGWDLSRTAHNFDFDACYCACPKGPCEHDFQGWRAFINKGGGETVCKRCGMGAMSHSIRTSE